MLLTRILSSPRLRLCGRHRASLLVARPRQWITGVNVLLEFNQKDNQYLEEPTKLDEELFNDFELTNDSPLRVAAVNLASKRDLGGLMSYLEKFGEQLTVILCSKKRSKDIPFIYVHITPESCLSASDPNSPYFLLWNGHDKHYLFFENGVVVGWGMTDADFKSLEMIVSQWDVERLESHVTEQMNYKIGDRAKIDTELDQLIITNERQFDLVVLFSIGLARSVKLEEIEIEVEKAVSEVHEMKFGHLDLDHRRGAMTCRDRLASIYHLEEKTTANRLLDDPDFLWDRPNSESELFAAHCTYLDITHRLKNAKDRLHLPHSYWELENKHFQLEGTWRLEIIIIVGIFLGLVLHLLGRSSNWQKFTLEKSLGGIYRELLLVLGIKSDTFSFGYDVIEEEVTYEIVKVVPKKDE